MRLNQERQAELEPKRVQYAKDQIIKLGYSITCETDKRIEFMFKGSKVVLYPYSGWFTGKTVKDGRGIDLLLKQIKDDKPV